MTAPNSSENSLNAGLDNRSAGKTAAYLLAQTLRSKAGVVLATKSQDSFLGEEERAVAFSQTLSQACPNLSIVEASGGSGVPNETARALEAVLDDLQGLVAVYSMGGGKPGHPRPPQGASPNAAGVHRS